MWYIPFTCGSPVAVRAIIRSLHVNAVAAVTAIYDPVSKYEVGRREGKYQAQIPATPRSQSHFLARIFAKIVELEN